MYQCLDVFFILTVVVRPPYEVTETGWGEFEIIIKIYFNDPNERPVSKFVMKTTFSLTFQVTRSTSTLAGVEK